MISFLPPTASGKGQEMTSSAYRGKVGDRRSGRCLEPRGLARLEPDFDKRVLTVTGTLVIMKLGQGGVLSAQGPMLKGSNYPLQTHLKQSNPVSSW